MLTIHNLTFENTENSVKIMSLDSKIIPNSNMLQKIFVYYTVKKIRYHRKFSPVTFLHHPATTKREDIHIKEPTIIYLYYTSN